MIDKIVNNGVKNYSKDKIKDAAKGRELEILRNVAGIPDDILSQPNKEHPCPKCEGNTRCRLVDVEKGAILCSHCFHEGNGDFIAAVMHFRGVSFSEALTLIGDFLLAGEPIPSTAISPATLGETTPKQTTISVYTDQEGKPLYRVKREDWIENGKPEKSFLQERWNSTLNNWESGTRGIAPVPLNWPALIARKEEPVCIVEGEKCCNALSSLGVLATTSGGSNTKIDWPKFTDVFHSGRDVFIFPDEDRVGYEYALKTADSLRAAGCKVKIIRIPGLGYKEDIADWIKRGGTREELDRIIADTPIWNGEQFHYENENGDKGKGTALSNEKPKGKKMLQAQWLDEVIQEPVKWLWKDRFQLGALSLVAGRGMSGKTTLVCGIVATVTNSEQNFFDGSPCKHHGSVLYFTTEARPANIRAKVESHGGTLSNCAVVQGWFFDDTPDNEQAINLQDTDAIEATIIEYAERGAPVRLAVIDPIGDYLGSKTDCHRDNEIREALSKFLKLAQKHNFAALAICHYRKDDDKTLFADDKIMGSAALGNLARNIFHVNPDPADQHNVRFAASKANDNVPAPLLRFRLTEKVLDEIGDDVGDDPQTTQYCVLSPSEEGDDKLWANELMRIDNAARRNTGNKPGPLPTEAERAKDWLRRKLNAEPDGIRQSELVDQWTNGEGGKKSTLDSAMKSICVTSQRFTETNEKGKVSTYWKWSLPFYIRDDYGIASETEVGHETVEDAPKAEAGDGDENEAISTSPTIATSKPTPKKKSKPKKKVAVSRPHTKTTSKIP